MMTWFKKLMGFQETDADEVRANLEVCGTVLKSRLDGRSFQFGRLEIPLLAELRKQIDGLESSGQQTTVREVVADAGALHCDPKNAGALFQVASQFNLLEMVSPDVTPEDGIGIYEHDRTQGPACAIACGAGTIYRNYFVPVHGSPGQTATNQIDCLADIGQKLGNQDGRLWRMENGYALPSQAGIAVIEKKLLSLNAQEIDELRKLLRIGIQWDTQVTAKNCQHTVTQAYCSALPVAYTGHASLLWEPFARLVLEAAYEATLIAAILNADRTGNRTVYLTLLGGGAFGNSTNWIIDAIQHALKKYQHWNLDVAIVSYGSSRGFIRELASQYSVNATHSRDRTESTTSVDESHAVKFKGRLRCLPCLDSADMARARMQELNISRDIAAERAHSALDAASRGYYFDSNGLKVDWRDAVKQARRAKKSIPADQVLPPRSTATFDETTIQVSNETTLAAAMRMAQNGLRPLALNFANGVVPGGGFLHGARAQEETICRSSALYETLDGDPMYDAHRERERPDSTDWMIYSPDVPVFRNDLGQELSQPWLLSLLTCAAPYQPDIGQPESGDLLEQRIRRVLAVAGALGYSSLVLGAWGCGAFGNDPVRTAQDFRNALQSELGRAFTSVTFAICDWSPERRFLGPFRDVF